MMPRIPLTPRLAILALAALVLGGCSSVSKTEYELAMQENSELRARNGQLEGSLQELNTRNATLEQENRDIAGQLDRTRSAGVSSGDTGFGGMAGITSYRTPGGDVIVDIAGDVLFDSGSATLKAASKKSLDRVAGVIQSRYGRNLIRVEGYTDSDPIRKSGWKTNERLSSERALAVEEYLVSKGVNNHRVYTAAFGAARPRSSKQQSRRVEIVILAGEG